MPLDHLSQGVHHQEVPHLRVFKDSPRGIAQPQPSDDHVQLRLREFRQPQVCQGDLGHGEHAGHQELFVQLYLVYVDAEGELPAAAQGQQSHRRGTISKLLKVYAHENRIRSFLAYDSRSPALWSRIAAMLRGSKMSMCIWISSFVKGMAAIVETNARNLWSNESL